MLKVNEFGVLMVNCIGASGKAAAPNTFMLRLPPKTVHLSAAALP